jgi:imidazolonepropionase-like amidohydrolase
VQSWIAVTPDSELPPVARANGVTHFEPTPEGGIVAGYSGLLSVSGWTGEQMAIKKPIALHMYWPAMQLDTTPREQARDKSRWKSLEEQAKERRAKLKALDDFFAEARAYAKARAVTNSATSLQPNPPWEAMLPVIRGEVPITIHADEVRQIESAVKWAATNRFQITLAGGRDAWRIAGLLATNRVPVIYAYTFTLPPRDTDAYDVQFRVPAILQKAGVPVAFSVSGADPASLAKNVPYDAAQAVAHGLPRDEALKGLTLYPARIAGVADRLGSIEVGKEASLFAADGDILDIRTNVKRLWIAGKEQPLDSRHTRLYEKYRNQPK